MLARVLPSTNSLPSLEWTTGQHRSYRLFSRAFGWSLWRFRLLEFFFDEFFWCALAFSSQQPHPESTYCRKANIIVTTEKRWPFPPCQGLGPCYLVYHWQKRLSVSYNLSRCYRSGGSLIISRNSPTSNILDSSTCRSKSWPHYYVDIETQCLVY